MTNSKLDNCDYTIEDIIEIYLSKARLGKIDDIAEFAKNYPEYEQDLIELLPGITSMEKLSIRHKKQQHAEVNFPKQLGQYQLIEKLGQGGMGKVYRAFDSSLGRNVAIKVLLSMWSEDDKLCKTFQKEAQLIAKLDHPNIVKVYGAGYDKHHAYYVMELINGVPLHKVDIDKMFPYKTRKEAIAYIGMQAAFALAYAHQHGILHRDIKPSNIILDHSGQIHISDFGMATLIQENEHVSLITTLQGGTLQYMPPERLMKNENGFASDQYSLGLTLYELYLGKAAFPQLNPGSLIKQICESSLPKLEGNDGFLSNIINKSISFRPQDRYTSMLEFANDLQRFLQNEPIKARPISYSKRFLLWTKRQPAIAALSIIVSGLTLISFISFYVGFIVLSRSLKNESEQRILSERNAEIAQKAMHEVFQQFSFETQDLNEPLTLPAGASRLLRALLPYYKEIVIQKDLPKKSIVQAYFSIGAILLRIGDNAGAERAFWEAYDLLESNDEMLAMQIQVLNRIGLALLRQGRIEDANSIWEKVIERHKLSQDINVQMTVISSLSFLIGHKLGFGGEASPKQIELQKKYRYDIFNLLQKVLTQNPLNQTALYVTASTLPDFENYRSHFPFFNDYNAFEILSNLIKENPMEQSYRIEYMRISLYIDYETADTQKEIYLKDALKHSEVLFASNPTEPDVLLGATIIRQRNFLRLRHLGNAEETNIEFIRILGLSKMLTNLPHYNLTTHKRLITTHLKFLSCLAHHDFPVAFRFLVPIIKKDIESFYPQVRDHYLQKLNEINEDFEKKHPQTPSV